MMQLYIPGQICEHCGQEIGRENYTLMQDNISRHLHKFHARCAPRDPDARKHHGMIAEPLHINAKGLILNGNV